MSYISIRARVSRRIAGRLIPRPTPSRHGTAPLLFIKERPLMSARRIERRSTQGAASLEVYLRDINETPLLSADEERELAERVATGDPNAREHMVKANLRLVINIARGYLGKGLSLEDLIE